MAPDMKTLLLMSAVLVTCFLFPGASGSKHKMPNILFILMDDMGWRDLGLRDPNFETPTIDDLYTKGFRLDSAYADPDGSSSRASLLSGRFSFKWGLQDNAISRYRNAHIPLNHTLLPKALKYLGYETHMVGKWHQGFCNFDQTPTHRGFDTFYGQYTSGADYFTRETDQYYDFRVDDEVVKEKASDYTTDLLNKRAIRNIKRHKKFFPQNESPFFIYLAYTAIGGPNQAPDKYLKKCKGYYEREDRRMKCGMMAAVDKGLGRVMNALKVTGQMDNTLVIFTSDNGGAADLGSSNHPLRGSKGTMWEGAIHVPTFMYSTNKDILPKMNHTYKGAFHMVDWYPTLIGFAKKRGKLTWDKNGLTPELDGFNFWRLIKRGSKKTFRREFGYIVQEADKNVAYVRKDHYKLVYNEERYTGWYNLPRYSCDKVIARKKNYRAGPFHLYFIKRDPNEQKDLSKSNETRHVAAKEDLIALLAQYSDNYVPKITETVDSETVALTNNAWAPGAC